jgi:hypothetical protein
MYKLQKIPSFSEPTCIVRLSDNLHIPFAPDNIDYQEYLKWVAEGNTPQPADEPN